MWQAVNFSQTSFHALFLKIITLFNIPRNKTSFNSNIILFQDDDFAERKKEKGLSFPTGVKVGKLDVVGPVDNKPSNN